MKKDTKTLNQLLDEYEKMFFDKGDHFEAGCSHDEMDQVRERAREIDAAKQACFVSGWTWWDLEVLPELKEAIETEGKQPVILKSDYMIRDERGRFHEGHWVRTSMLTVFHSPALFETANTFYVMVGPGSVKLCPSIALLGISRGLLIRGLVFLEGILCFSNGTQRESYGRSIDATEVKIMTIYELRQMVPVYEDPWIRLIDIPNPYRSQFYADSLEVECFVILDQGLCYCVWDWEIWLSQRRHLDYTLRHPYLYRLISDDEALGSITSY